MKKCLTATRRHPVYLEVPGATHVSILDSVSPTIFEFFDQNKRQ
jgi:hypothetical protein